MAPSRKPGPVDTADDGFFSGDYFSRKVQEGWRCDNNGCRFYPPGPVGNPNTPAASLLTINLIKAELTAFGAQFTVDAAARQSYTIQIEAMAKQLIDTASSGEITWAEAASQAVDTRNTIMEMVRGRSTPVGRALAEQLKSQGKTLNELIARKTAQLFGENAKFAELAAAEQNTVYAEIVSAAGRSNPRVTALLGRVRYAGRGLLILSLGLAIYNIATADDKLAAAGKEAAYAGVGIGGSIAGGALAGLACGPGAPVCVAIGAFAGGALAVLGASSLWDSLSHMPPIRFRH